LDLGAVEYRFVAIFRDHRAAIAFKLEFCR
jgi:hypothetical protein